MLRALAAITAVLLLVALAGCGDDIRDPADVAREYVASDDPEKCEDADIGFLERQTRQKNNDAIAACKRNVERSKPPTDVRVRSSEVDGNRAEVLLVASGQEIRVTLRRAGGNWRVTGF